MIVSEMNKEKKLKILSKYKQKDGTIVLPIGLTLNSWWNINARYQRPKTLIDQIKEIEEEINYEKYNELS